LWVATTFPQGYLSPRYNAKDHVLALNRRRPAASIMVFGLDPRFDLSQAHGILDGIASINPIRASVHSAAWASPIVNGDLAYENGARFQPTGGPSCPTTERHFRAASPAGHLRQWHFWPTA
jgi:purine nucleoside permease